MNNPLRRLRDGRAPVGLLGALAIVVCVESSIERHKLDTMDGSLWTYQQCRDIASTGARDYQLLAFGDSLMKHGIAPKVIREATGMEGYNFAIPGSQIPAHYFLFREAIESGARPKVVLLDLFPCLLSSDPWDNNNITNWPIVTSYRDAFEMAWQGRDSNFFASLISRKALPSVRCRESIRPAIRESLNGFSGFTKGGIRAVLRNWEVNRGLAIGEPRHNSAIALDFWIKLLFKPVKVTPLNQYYIDKFMELADAHGVKVFLVMPPYQAELQARLEQAGWDAEHEAFVRGLLAKYPDLAVLDARKSNVHPLAFIDTHHLGYAGASTFSAMVGETLRDRLAKPGPAERWVSMPAYVQRPITVRHESPDESRIAVVHGDQKLRR